MPPFAKSYPNRGSKAPVGTGERFRALVSSIKSRSRKTAKRKGGVGPRGGKPVDDPAAVAAAAGRAKYGKKKFQQLAAAGRSRAAARRKRRA